MNENDMKCIRMLPNKNQRNHCTCLHCWKVEMICPKYIFVDSILFWTQSFIYGFNQMCAYVFSFIRKIRIEINAFDSIPMEFNLRINRNKRIALLFIHFFSSSLSFLFHSRRWGLHIIDPHSKTKQSKDKFVARQLNLNQYAYWFCFCAFYFDRIYLYWIPCMDFSLSSSIRRISKKSTVCAPSFNVILTWVSYINRFSMTGRYVTGKCECQ